VVPDLRACLDDAAQGLAAAVRGSQTAEGEEGRLTLVLRQQVENRPGPGRGTVVEGERDNVFADVRALFERGHSRQS